MKLDDVFVHCNHDTSAEIAIENWERRRKKINFEELFVAMYTKNEETAKQFSEIPGFKNKLCLVPFETEMNYCVSLEWKNKEIEFGEIVNNSVNAGTTYDVLRWLSGKMP